MIWRFVANEKRFNSDYQANGQRIRVNRARFCGRQGFVDTFKLYADDARFTNRGVIVI